MASALKAVAYGSTLRAAATHADAPYSTLNKTWKAMGGDTKGPAWQAFIASLPPKPEPAAATPAPAVAAEESPLGPRLKRKADRYGDAVPYGKHGEWGLFREGIKEMTTRISEGKISAADAQAELEAAGVHTSAWTLQKKAKVAPGKSPSKTGMGSKLDYDIQAEVHKEIQILRKHDLPVTKSMVKCMVLSKLTDEQQEDLLPKGITNRIYYGFLDSFDMNTEETKPLESDRDLWLNSKVRFVQQSPPRSELLSFALLHSWLCLPALRATCSLRTKRRATRSGPTWQ